MIVQVPMIVQVVVAALLSLAVAPAMQAQSEAEREAESNARYHVEHRAESEASVRFTLRVNSETHRLQLITASMCESYRVRAKAIERGEREFPSARAHIDLDEFPYMTDSGYKEVEAVCREFVQKLQDSRESAEREIREYQSGEKPRCCLYSPLVPANQVPFYQVQELFGLHMQATLLCLQGLNQLHVKAGTEIQLANPRLAGIVLLHKKAEGLAQDVVDTACPLPDKYASWARDVDPDRAAVFFASRPGDP